MTIQETSNANLLTDIISEKATGKYSTPIAAGLRLAANRVSMNELAEFAEKTGSGRSLWGQFICRRNKVSTPSVPYDFGNFVIDVLDDKLDD